MPPSSFRRASRASAASREGISQSTLSSCWEGRARKASSAESTPTPLKMDISSSMGFPRSAPAASAPFALASALRSSKSSSRCAQWRVSMSDSASVWTLTVPPSSAIARRVSSASARGKLASKSRSLRCVPATRAPLQLMAKSSHGAAGICVPSIQNGRPDATVMSAPASWAAWKAAQTRGETTWFVGEPNTVPSRSKAMSEMGDWDTDTPCLAVLRARL